MAKRREVDPGLQYLQKIGFNRIRGPHGLADRWITLYGKKKANELFDRFDARVVGSKEFYEFKNSSLSLSSSISEAYDGDIIRKACNYISAHKEFFGHTILEVGCESGYMTGFLAITFPESQIVSIDRSESAIEIAKQRIAQLNVSNVSFRCCGPDAIDEEFDTVFCMRTIQENYDHEAAPFIGEPFTYQCFKYADLTSAYTDSLMKCLKDTGTFCVFERLGYDPLMCGWMLSLNAWSCSINKDSYENIVCEEANERSTFQAFVAAPGAHSSEADVIRFWYETIEIDFTGLTTLTSWQALIYLNDNAGELIKGIYVYDADDVVVGRFAIFYDCDSKETIYYLMSTNGETNLFSASSEQLEDFLKHMESAIAANNRGGNHCRDINTDTDPVERSIK